MNLEDKIEFSKSVIREWYKHWDGNVFVSFSGGKDSTVLLHLVRSLYPEVKGAFANTGLEYPEIYSFVRKQENVEISQPVKKFPQVLMDNGYPITNKSVATRIYSIQHPTKNNFNTRRLNLIGWTTSKKEFNKGSKIPNKWMPVAFSDVNVTYACCDFLKKNPLKKWRKKHKYMKPFIGMRQGESDWRDYIVGMRDCNVFGGYDASSIPLKFWTDEDIYNYIEREKLEICEVYDKYKLSRTGCTFCAYGAEQEPENDNRFTKLKKSHPKQFNIFVHNLGMNKALDYAGINYGEEPTYRKPPNPVFTCCVCKEVEKVKYMGFITEREWTKEEENRPTPLSGMNTYCKKCAKEAGLPVRLDKFI